MIELTLSNIPNQSFSIQLDGHQYDWVVRSINANNMLNVGIMAVDIMRDNIPLVTGARATPLFPLLPYRYLENNDGNFIFVTLNGQYPDYTQFGITQALIYVSQTELEAIRAGT
jgi:hypothetical protein